MNAITRTIPFLFLIPGVGCLDAFRAKDATAAKPAEKEEAKPEIKELKPSSPPSARKVEPLHTDYITKENSHSMADRMGEEMQRDLKVLEAK